MQADFTTDINDWTKVFLELAEVQKKELPFILRDSARELAKTLAHQTQPFGLTQEAKKQGENAVVRDIMYAYITPTTVYSLIRKKSESLAKAFYRALKDNNIPLARHLIEKAGYNYKEFLTTFDHGGYHTSQRNERGRVSRRTMPKVVDSSRSLNAYIKEVKSHVGAAKAGWASASADLGGTSAIPQWVRRHISRVAGYATVSATSEGQLEVVIASRVKYARQVLSDSQIKEALRISREKMLKRIQHILNNRKT
jgi:hypothetical protein